MNAEELYHRLGQIVDKADDYLDASSLPLPPFLRADGLKAGLRQIRDDTKQLYFDLGGTDVWDESPGIPEGEELTRSQDPPGRKGQPV